MSPNLASPVLFDMRFGRMRTGVQVIVSASDRHRLAAIISVPSAPQKPVWRARVIRFSAAGSGTGAIRARPGKSKTCVWRWQARFMAEGVDGLLHQKPRLPGIPKTAVAKTAVDKTAEVIRPAPGSPPQDATHRTLRAMAEAVGLAASTGQSIGKSYGPAPQRRRQFKRSDDPAFAEKRHAVAGLHGAPSGHAAG